MYVFLAAVMQMTAAQWSLKDPEPPTLKPAALWETLGHFGRCPKVWWTTSASLFWPFDFAKQNVKSWLRGRMSDWITVALVCVCVCVCVWGVKVGYSLLLGHVANPLTLAWILLTDPFSSNKHTLLPDGGGLQDSATGVKVHEQPGEAFT